VNDWRFPPDGKQQASLPPPGRRDVLRVGRAPVHHAALHRFQK
jgi:hypothetical protein